jgi:CheY-like chemotaxis protein
MPSERIEALVVDDAPVNQLLASRVLEKLGCTVSTAANGAEALELLELQQFHIIFMECHMPVLDGFETTRIIRQGSGGRTVSSVPIVGISASATADERALCLVAGMNDHLEKPMTRERVSVLLSHWVPASNQA